MHSLLIAILFAAAAPQATPPVTYSDLYAERYSEVTDAAIQFPATTPLEPAIVVSSRLGTSTAHILRTDGVKIPYESAEAHLSVTSELASTVYFSVKGFRSITATWIGERLLFIRRDVGHVAAIEEIYDVVDGKWLLQQSVHYRWP
ncbi:MAG: hypothetical protein OES38_00825 [Gammaproteobacteria bacterium]|nr:hypothetical protein [Gammaproteobacteria bacterium]